MKGQSLRKGKVIIGITGSFGSGKTTVARMFARYRVSTIDADRLTHRLLRPGTSVYRRIIAAFGTGIINRDRTLNRSALARIVFNDRALLRRLRYIIHPQVIRKIRQELRRSSRHIVVLDAPLLIEAGLRNLVDVLIVVTATKERQIARIRAKTGLARGEILRRIRAQMPLSQKVCMADFIIDNNKTKEATRRQVENIWKKLNLS